LPRSYRDKSELPAVPPCFLQVGKCQSEQTLFEPDNGAHTVFAYCGSAKPLGRELHAGCCAAAFSRDRDSL